LRRSRKERSSIFLICQRDFTSNIRQNQCLGIETSIYSGYQKRRGYLLPHWSRLDCRFTVVPKPRFHEGIAGSSRLYRVSQASHFPAESSQDHSWGGLDVLFGRMGCTGSVHEKTSSYALLAQIQATVEAVKAEDMKKKRDDEGATSWARESEVHYPVPFDGSTLGVVIRFPRFLLHKKSASTVND
jgi:hypothetical protein